ncbi:MAG: sensory box histidine kinase/response regulator [Caulobacteraceae bacterium]|nr:sensory box histidine kinase/response regulator [Caulobacteraceae bacterium]
MSTTRAVEAEEAMLTAELMGLAGLSSWRLDRHGVVASARLRAMLGVSQDQVLDREAFRAFLHPDDYDRVRACNERLLSEGGSANVDLRIRDGDGWRRVRTTLLAKRNADGEWVIYGVGQDLTELTDAHDAALRAEQQVRGLMEDARVAGRRLKLALGVAQAGVFEIDHEAGSFWCSPEFVLLVGRRMTYAEARMTIWPFIHPEDEPKILAALKSWQDGTSISQPLELRVVRPDGSVRWVRVYYELRHDASGKIKHNVGLILDIDERKRQMLALADAERAALAATEAKSRFLASMSHEIRTPMNGVLGVLHLLRAEPLSGGGRDLLDEALQCGHMLSELINDLLDLSKIEADRMQLSPAPTDPAATLRGVANMLRPEAEAKGLVIDIEGDLDCGWSLVDPVRLRQALFNLLGNAVKFTPQGRIVARLSVHGQGEARRLRYEIEDTGLGIPAEAQSRLFERFQQADNSTTRRFGGTGLGLAITRHLVHLMDGEIGFTSAVGQGSTFWFEIAARSAPMASALRARAPDGLHGLRVLVVEDNGTNRLIARKILETMGAEVETAEDGAAGVEAAQRLAPDLILMDVQMPGMDGMEATRRIRGLRGALSRTPIIALTANVLEHQRQAYMECGMDGVVGKPISPTTLLSEMLRLVEAAAPLSAALPRAG